MCRPGVCDAGTYVAGDDACAAGSYLNGMHAQDFTLNTCDLGTSGLHGQTCDLHAAGLLKACLV